MGFLVKGCTRDRHFPGGSASRVRLLCRRPWFDPWVEKIPWRRDRLPIPVFMDFPGGSAGKESACHAGDLGSIPGLGRSPLEESVLLSGESRGQRSLVGYSPGGHKGSDTTE